MEEKHKHEHKPEKMHEHDGFGAETEAYLVQAIYQWLNSEYERRRDKVST